MNEIASYWNHPLVTLSSGAQITVSQVVLTILLIIFGLVFTWYLQRLVGRQLIKAKVEPNVAQTVQRIVFYSLLIALFITTLGMLRIPVTALAFISGGVAIGIGFGAQAIINNLISGWILMSERPVRIGDFVEIDAHRGVVEEIGNRSTRIKRVDGVHLMVPNSQMLERVVVNWTLVDRNFRTTIRVGVAYGSPVRRVSEILMQATVEQPDSLDEPKPIIVFDDFGDNALIFEIFFWCRGGGERELRVIRSDIRYRIEQYLNEEGIVIAFPQRDVHLYARTPIEVVAKDA